MRVAGPDGSPGQSKLANLHIFGDLVVAAPVLNYVMARVPQQVAFAPEDFILVPRLLLGVVNQDDLQATSAALEVCSRTSSRTLLLEA